MARIYQDKVEGEHVKILPKYSSGKILSDKEFKSITDTTKRPYNSYEQNRQR